MELKCTACGKTFSKEEYVCSISGSIMGDECTDSYYFCPVCRVYTVDTCWDNFTGEETYSTSGPISKQDGDKRIEIIKQCTDPWDKKCRCSAHRSYFNDTLD